MRNIFFSIVLLFFCCSFVLENNQRSLKTITFSEHIAPIFFSNCTGCHHIGGVGSFSLIDFQSAYNYRNAIQGSVLSGYMPPWPPDTNYSNFRHERILSNQEINLINTWVGLGAPEGNPNLTPPAPNYNTSGPQLGTPDLTLSAPAYSSNAFQNDDYVCFTIPSNLLTDKKIRAVEVVPGNLAIVHHCLVYIDPSGNSSSGVQNNCMGPTNGNLVGEFAPGSLPITYPGDDNMAFGMNFPANSNVILAMHYPVGSLGMIDSTKVHFYFYPDQVNQFREIEINPIIQNLSFCVPPNQTKTVNDDYQIPNSFPALSLFGVFPHMHLIGKSIETYGLNLNGDTTNFIKIPDWDFEWQGAYHFRKMLKLDPGSTIKASAFYDNTSANLHNPNIPPQTICGGLNTTDEMFVIYYLYTNYMSGDENLDLDSLSQNGMTSIETNYLLNSSVRIFPNPVEKSFTVESNWAIKEIDKIEFYDLGGNLIYSEKINEISNFHFQKNYNKSKIFNSASNKVSLVRIYHNNGNVQYGKVIAK